MVALFFIENFRKNVSFIFIDEIKNTAKSVVPIAILVIVLNLFVGVETGLLVNFFLGCVGVIIGLGVFLTGVEISVSEIGSMMGEFLARFDRLIKVIVFGVFIGFTISIAEPDLLILAGEVTSAIGVSTQMIVMIISLGVGIMILPRGKGSKFMNLLNDFGAVAIGCFYGEGSASNEILNTLAIDKTKKK